MSWSFTNGLSVQFLTGQTTADVVNVVDTSFHIIAAATGITVAPGIASSSRIRFIA